MFSFYIPSLSQPASKEIFAPKLQIRKHLCDSIELVIININKHLIKEIVWLKNDSISLDRSTEEKSTLFGGKNGEGTNDTHFRFPSSAVVYKDQLYIADLFNHRIQSWKLMDTKAYTVISDDAGYWNNLQLHYPTDVFINSKGQLFITDQEKHRVVLFDNEKKSLITVAGGNGRGIRNDQFRSPSGIFVHEKTGNIYVADTYNQRIQKWIPGNKQGITVA
jgi:DNA-binding beta-propeller fold protein YncE